MKPLLITSLSLALAIATSAQVPDTAARAEALQIGSAAPIQKLAIPSDPEAKLVELAPDPTLTPAAQPPVRLESTNVSTPTTHPSISNLPAQLAETAFPQVVRKTMTGYDPINVPPGWKMVPLRALKFDPAPTVKLANGEDYSVQSPPFVLVPVTENTRVAINPRALQTLHNFYLAQLELMRQINEALAANAKSVTPID